MLSLSIRILEDLGSLNRSIPLFPEILNPKVLYSLFKFSYFPEISFVVVTFSVNLTTLIRILCEKAAESE